MKKKQFLQMDGTKQPFGRTKQSAAAVERQEVRRRIVENK